MLDWILGSPLAVGSRAPNFKLRDERGDMVTLASLRGKNVVLVFYPADETSVCTAQLCEFRDQWADVEARNAVVFGVNSQSAEKHAAFRTNRKFPFPLLVDEGQTVAKLYHAHGPGFVRRTVYLIGPDGTIRYAQRGKPAPADVLSAAA